MNSVQEIEEIHLRVKEQGKGFETEENKTYQRQEK